MEFRGAITALVTPFRNGEVDEEAFRAFIEWQIEQGIHGLIPLGSTGEFLSLSDEEQEAVAETVIRQAAGRVLLDHRDARASADANMTPQGRALPGSGGRRDRVAPARRGRRRGP